MPGLYSRRAVVFAAGAARARRRRARARPRRRGRAAAGARSALVDADARRRARRPLDARRSVAAPGRPRPGGDGARPPARHLPRHRAVRAASRRCGGCTAVSPRRAAISRAPSRLHGRALKHAETAHDSRAIGLAHYELGQCYRQVGDIAIVREHITEGRLRAARRRRPPPPRAGALAVGHARSRSWAATTKRWPRCGRPSASPPSVQADDVLATVCGNQANVTMLQHRYEQALALAERSVALHEAHGSGHGLAVALATLGQICVRLGDLGARRRRAAPRARRPQPDSVPRDDRRRLRHAGADSPDARRLRDRQRVPRQRAGEAYGAYGRQTSRWYEWSVRVLGARLALRRGDARRGASRSPTRSLQAGAPPFDALQATLIAAEALTAADRLDEAEQRLAPAADALDPRIAPGAWGEFLRLRGALHAQAGQRRRGVPRLRAERGAARSARRALPGGAQPARARPPGRAKPARARSPSATSNKALGDLRAARRRARSRRHATPRRRC